MLAECGPRPLLVQPFSFPFQGGEVKPELITYRTMWKSSPQDRIGLPPDYPGWPDSGLAVMGDFSGIQTFVFRPVPGAGGAARRLRSRSFRVSCYSEMIMRWCKETFAQGQPKILHSAGGKFLIGLNAFEGWEATLEKMRVDLDRWAWENFGGELIFHLAVVPFEGSVVPYEHLHQAISDSRTRPLTSVLISQQGWSADAFFQAAASGDGKCDACGMTRQLTRDAFEDEDVCDGCIQDENLGKKLPGSRYARIAKKASKDLSFLETNMELSQSQTGPGEGEWLSFGGNWPLLHYLPRDRGGPLTFEEIAKRAAGPRKWLGYLRIDGDGAGKHFRSLQGDARRTWGLSRLLNVFFAQTANDLIEKKFPNIYPVYGGGDDLFVVGPWNELLDFSLKLRQELRSIAGNELTFSAGLSLAKPKEHILTQANLAGQQLDIAKKIAGYGRETKGGRDQIRALGVTTDWETFARLLPVARDVTGWIEENEGQEGKQMPSGFLQQVLRLHHYWEECRKESNGRTTAKVERYKPLLYYQIQRNLKSDKPREWAEGLLKPNSLWPWADFIARYAMLAAKRGEGKE
jgi:CRISPR-associated protein Csm1